MTVVWNNEKIKAFVKDTLGCGCPDKVFEKIDTSELLTAEYEKEIVRIVIGDTLLIYIICPVNSADFSDSVEAIALAGKNDRDKNHYNRFRLVVSGLESDDLQAKVFGRFKTLFDIDDKMHIHFLGQQLIDGLS